MKKEDIRPLAAILTHKKRLSANLHSLIVELPAEKKTKK